MDASQDFVGTRPEGEVGLLSPLALPLTQAPGRTSPLSSRRERKGPSGRHALLRSLAWPAGVYFASRAFMLALAAACNAVFGHLVPGNTLARELSNWDGWWYIHLASRGYPTHVSHGQTTLGFFPLYSMVMWAVAHAFFISYRLAGLVISGLGGFVAVVLVQRLVTDWWGEEVARKAVLFFCIFPGTVVFSMDYSEGLLIPLVAGLLLALSRKRWLLAGVLAAFASGIGPDSLVVVPTCAAAALVELRRRGWQDRAARRSLVAPLLSPLGAIGFAVFLWVWTGTPLASYIAQKDGWHESTNPIALLLVAGSLAKEIGFGLHFNHVDLNNVVGLLGTVFLVFGLVWLWRERRRLPLEVLVFTGCMAFLMVTSRHVPPNPRLLLTAFPVVVVYARRLAGRSFRAALATSGFFLVVLSSLTYVGGLLRP